LCASAKFCDIDVIVSRDKKGFAKFSVLVQEPKAFLASLI